MKKLHWHHYPEGDQVLLSPSDMSFDGKTCQAYVYRGGLNKRRGWRVKLRTNEDPKKHYSWIDIYYEKPVPALFATRDEAKAYAETIVRLNWIEVTG